MCDTLFSCFSLSFVDTLVTALIFVLNVLYVVWGWFTPNDPQREDLSEYIQKLKSYLNFVTYSDSFMLPIKVLLLVLLRYMCCKKNKQEAQGATDFKKSEVEDAEESPQCTPKLFNYDITPVKKTTNTFTV